MFDGFSKKTDLEIRRRYAFSAGISVVLYGTIAAAALVVASRSKPVEDEEPKVEVVFRPPPPVEAPPPPPPPKIVPRPPAIIPEGMKTKVVDALPPPTELVEPKKIPTEKLAEGNAEDDAVAVLDPSKQGKAGGREGGTAKEEPPAPPPPPVVKRLEPINLPEDATPPVEDENNDHDGDKFYPMEAKAKGLEGLVILKIVITDSGEVGTIKVLKGDEPFVAAAIAMVKSWHYSPALVEGKPQAVFKVLKIPFKLKS